VCVLNLTADNEYLSYHRKLAIGRTKVGKRFCLLIFFVYLRAP